MYNVVFCGGESAGTIGNQKPIDNVAFRGGESCGSIGKQKPVVQKFSNVEVPNPQGTDTVSFRGRDYNDDSSSLGSVIATGLALATLIIGGLGYAHKTGAIGKLKDGKIKDLLKKTDTINETCYNWCHKVKEVGVEYYEKVKNTVSKK